MRVVSLVYYKISENNNKKYSLQLSDGIALEDPGRRKKRVRPTAMVSWMIQKFQMNPHYFRDYNSYYSCY